MFIDRKPDCFAVHLDLRTGDLNIPPSIPEKSSYQEVSFYGILVRDEGGPEGGVRVVKEEGEVGADLTRLKERAGLEMMNN
ncbi:hypothetical protein CRG98_029678 [Punica granatum]|uniref:Uncharacterized protein n=1 Tax=Punica granatum TaxID=22663 RepID=A0A2I0J2L6_PUNGR|nr:hypothetical protein CRG98_029678 [Punica granatum]